MTRRMTAAEYQALNQTGKPRTTRKEAAGPYHTVCKTCGQEFRTKAAESHHVVDEHHFRFEVVMTP